jgi:hypothetical protein
MFLSPLVLKLSAHVGYRTRTSIMRFKTLSISKHMYNKLVNFTHFVPYLDPHFVPYLDLQCLRCIWQRCGSAPLTNGSPGPAIFVIDL